MIEIERLDKDLNNVAMVAESARRLCLQWEKGLMLFDLFVFLTATRTSICLPTFSRFDAPLAAFSPRRFIQRWPTGASLRSYALDTTAQRAWP